MVLFLLGLPFGGSFCLVVGGEKKEEGMFVSGGSVVWLLRRLVVSFLTMRVGKDRARQRDRSRRMRRILT